MKKLKEMEIGDILILRVFKKETEIHIYKRIGNNNDSNFHIKSLLSNDYIGYWSPEYSSIFKKDTYYVGTSSYKCCIVNLSRLERLGELKSNFKNFIRIFNGGDMVAKQMVIEYIKKNWEEITSHVDKTCIEIHD